MQPVWGYFLGTLDFNGNTDDVFYLWGKYNKQLVIYATFNCLKSSTGTDIS